MYSCKPGVCIHLEALNKHLGSCHGHGLYWCVGHANTQAQLIDQFCVHSPGGLSSSSF